MRSKTDMNILLLTYQGDVAGSTSSIAYLATGLASKGHRVYVGARQESLLFRLLAASGVKLLPMTFHGKCDSVNTRQIRDAVTTYQIDVINAQSSYDRYTSILERWRYKLPVKVVHTRRQIPRSAGGWLQNLFYARGTDKIVAVSSEVKRALVRRGIPASHIAVIANGIPHEKYTRPSDPHIIDRLKQQYHIRPDEIVIGCVARRKKQEQLLQALQFLPFSVKVVFVGIRQEEVDQTLLASARMRHEIIFCGQVAPELAINYYALFTLHVLPSTIEGLSQTLLEAMALGVPAIATGAAGNLDVIVEGQNGYLFEDGNPQELAAKILYVIQYRQHLQAVLANAKRTATETFSLTRTIDAYEQLFTQLMTNRSRQRPKPLEILSPTPVA